MTVLLFGSVSRETKLIEVSVLKAAGLPCSEEFQNSLPAFVWVYALPPRLQGHIPIAPSEGLV